MFCFNFEYPLENQLNYIPTLKNSSFFFNNVVLAKINIYYTLGNIKLCVLIFCFTDLKK